MIKISKLADYSLQVLLILMAEDSLMSAAKCSQKIQVPVTTVSKVLKILIKAGLVVSVQGTKGGYRLAKAGESISLADLVAAVDGPLALTECSKPVYDCPQQSVCGQQENWQTITRVVFNLLNQISLKDMSGRVSAEKLQILQFMPNKNKKL